MKDILGTIVYLRTMYGLRNALRHDSLRGRIDILEHGLYELDQVIAEKTERDLRTSVASIFALTVAVLDHFTLVERSLGKSVSQMLVETLLRKYASGCTYCGNLKCNCVEEDRPKSKWRELDVSTGPQQDWTLSCFQEHLHGVYGEKNERRGVPAAAAAIGAEVRELRRVNLIHAKSQFANLKLLEEYLEEIADIIARLCAFASLSSVNVDVGVAVQARYGYGCPKCNKPVCDCTLYRMSVKDALAAPKAETKPL